MISETTSAPPTFRKLPPGGLGSRLVGKEEVDLLREVVTSGKLFRYDYETAPAEQGKMTARLEREICATMGAGYALAVTSGTAALEVALGALGVGPGDEVIIPAWGWVSCFTAVVRMGALPVLAEIDETFSLAQGEITRLKTERTRAVMVLHYQGAAADMDPLLKEAGDIPILEDCAQSIGATYRGRAVGTMGAIGIYSFQFQKVVTSGEGGMVVTNDERLYERAVRMHDLGFCRPYHLQLIDSPHEEQFCGGQYRMNEVTAAVALAQFRRLGRIKQHTRNLSRRLMTHLAPLEDILFRCNPDPNGDLGFEVYLNLPDAHEARELGKILAKLGLSCHRTTGTYCHYARPYCQQRAVYHEPSSPFQHFKEWPAKGYRPEDFPKTEAIISRFISLPIGMLYTTEDIDYIASVVTHAYTVLKQS